MGDPAGGDRLFERLGDVILADDVVERGGTVAAGEDSVSHRRIY